MLQEQICLAVQKNPSVSPGYENTTDIAQLLLPSTKQQTILLRTKGSVSLSD